MFSADIKTGPLPLYLEIPEHFSTTVVPVILTEVLYTMHRITVLRHKCSVSMQKVVKLAKQEVSRRRLKGCYPM